MAGGRLWFVAAPDGFNQRLWSTDGTESGTVAADLVPGAAFQVTDLASDGTRLLVAGGTSADDMGLWLTDGTAAGTHRLGAITLETPVFRSPPVTLGGALYFTAGTADRPFDPVLWKSDGTAEGTAPVLDPNGPVRLYPNFLRPSPAGWSSPRPRETSGSPTAPRRGPR